MAMQVGDATRQRIEHIETALQTLADLVDGHAVGEIAVPADDRPAVVADICLLQAAQLTGTASSFDVDLAGAGNALRELAADARTVMARSQDVYGESDSKGQSSLPTLSAEMRHAVAVLRDCETERNKLEQVAAAVQATVRVLLDHVEAVQHIEENMRLVSLNAAIKCAQLGPRGRALNVIARQLRELTGDIVAAAEAAMTSLGETVALARSFSAASSGEAAGQISWLEQEAMAAVGLLETVDKRLNDALGVLHRDGPAAVKLLGLAASGLSDHADIAEAMADARIRVAAFTAINRESAGTAEISRPILRLLQRNYTMESERRTHEDLVGSGTDEAAHAAPASKNAAQPELDDIFL
jgi:hypothetical protein